MKRFIRKKSVHSILEIIGVFAIFTALILVVCFLIGCRFVYPEQFSNDWNAVSGVAAWFSVVASFVAVCYAVQVADKQNQIELFEKRYTYYAMVQNLLFCSDALRLSTSDRTTYIALKFYFGKIIGRDDIQNAIDLECVIEQIEYRLKVGRFLFSNYNFDLLKNILDKGGELGGKTYQKNQNNYKKELSKEALKLKSDYCELCDKFKATCFKDMEEELDLV